MGNISSTSKGMYKGKSHAEGGIPVVVDGNTNVEIEGNEYHLCRDAMSSAKIYSFKNKSNKEILDSIYSSEGCKFVQGIANSGDFIVCKLVVLDDDKRTISGTVKSIIDTMQSEKSCNVSEGGNKMEKGGYVAISQFNRNINNELKNYIDEDEEVSFEYKRERVKLVYAKKFYEKNNIIPLAEPDLEISSFLTQWVSYNDSNYQISFHYNFVIGSIKLEKVKATLYSEDWDEIKTFTAVNPTQIKLANGSNTTFDGNNDDIRYEDGGSIDEHKETYEKWKSLVNMSKSELKEFYDSQEGKDAGLSDKESNDLGISNGRESARWIMRMKDTPVSDWTPKMWEWANKQISFISRMSGNKGSLYDDNGNKTRKHTSLLIWGHNPKKMSNGGEIIPQQGTLFTKDKKNKLEYQKKGNNYVFKVYNPKESKELSMNYNQFINYLYTELYIDDKMGNGGDIKDLILSKKIELNFYRTSPDHALEYGIKAKNPLYLKNFHVTKTERLKGIGKKMLKYLDDYAIENGNDVIFGHINQKATFSKNQETYFNDTQLIKNWLQDNGYAVNDDDNNFHKVVGAKMKQGGNVITYRNKFNKKYGFELNESHSLEEIAKLTSLKLSALQDIYNKGIGAYKTNPESVRPIVKSKEQWAMARVYSAVMGGKASKVDANELERGKMEEGGEIDNLFELTIYNVIAGGNNDLDTLYFGTNFNEAEQRYEYADSDDLSDSDKINGGLVEFQKKIDTYKFVYELDKEYNEEISDYPIEEYYEDRKYYKLIDEKEFETIKEKQIIGSKEIELENKNKGIDLLDDVVSVFKKKYPRYVNAGYITKNSHYFLIPIANTDKSIELRISDHSPNLRNIDSNANEILFTELVKIGEEPKKVDRTNEDNYDVKRLNENYVEYQQIRPKNRVALINCVIYYGKDETYKKFDKETKYNLITEYFDLDNYDYDTNEVVEKIDELIEEEIYQFENNKNEVNVFAKGGNIPNSNMELLAPNGNKSNLNHEQWHLVRTPAFKQWFGDWEKLEMAKIKDSAMDEVTLANISKDVSKVVDSNGEPLVVYHGTKNEFNIFDKRKRGSNTDNGIFGKGFYFSKRLDTSKSYGNYIIEAFLNIINPFNNSGFLNKSKLAEHLDINEDILREGGTGISSLQSFTGIFSDAIKEKGHDGVITKFGEYVTFEPNQIKLADGSNTTFDGNNDDIRYEDGGGIEFVPEKKGTLIKGNEIIKYFEKVNGNYRLIFYTLNETKGKVLTMCHSFGYCQELDSENVTPKELVELIKKNNLMEKGGEVEDRISQIDKEKIIILNEVDILIREHKKLYRNIDISMPKSDAEKQSDKKIANLLSRANELVMEKRNLISKSNKMAKGGEIEYKEGGNIKNALNDIEKAPSVKYWMQPEFIAETYKYEQKGKPDSFVKIYDEKYNGDTILAYNKRGNLVGLFSISKGGDEQGAFKIVVREDSINKGWGKKLLDEAEKQGIDIVGNIKRNSFSHSGRNLLRSWLSNKMENKMGDGGSIDDDKNKEELVKKCFGWSIYKKIIGQNIVYKAYNNEQSYMNEEDWNLIKGDIYINTGFKWCNFANLEKWVRINSEENVIKKLCYYLTKYYYTKN